MRFGISPLVKMECMVAPLWRGDPLLEQAYTEVFGQFVALNMPESVYLQAAQLRARFGLSTRIRCTWPVPSIIAAMLCGPRTTASPAPRTDWRRRSCNGS